MHNASRLSVCLQAYLSSHMHAKYFTHFILLDMFTPIIFAVEYKSWSPSLCRLEHRMSSWSTCSRTHPVFFPRVGIHVSHSHKTARKITVLPVFNLYILSSKRWDSVLIQVVTSVSWVNCCCVVMLCALFCCFEKELRPSFVATFL